MDILTHTLSGLVVGTVLANFSNEGFKHKFKIILFAGIAGALPDIDAISLWSGFDSTIGEFFNLSHTGREIYSSKLWYSHHAFMHSIFGGLLFASLLGVVSWLIKSKFQQLSFRILTESLRKDKLILGGFVLGFIIHLLEDIPTPASSWGGVNFFWPMNTYTGGLGDIWWWNNYDIFLIVFAILIANITLLLVKRALGVNTRKLAIAFFIVGFVSIIVQTKTRAFDFSYTGHTNKYQEFESKSLELQQSILGKRLFQMMESFDNKLTIYF